MTAEHDPAQQPADPRFAAPPSARPASPLQRRNRLLALLLTGVGLFGFVTVLSLAMLLHYAEANHLFANL